MPRWQFSWDTSDGAVFRETVSGTPLHMEGTLIVRDLDAPVSAPRVVQPICFVPTVSREVLASLFASAANGALRFIEREGVTL